MSDSQSHRWRRRVIIATIVVCIAICSVVSFDAWLDHTIGEPMRIRDQMHKSIESLAAKCPPDVPQDQWNVAVNWTNNLPGECFLPGWADLNDMRRFQHELDERVKGKVDMKLIFWIWDEVAKISPAGPQYKQKFQKAMLDEMQLSEPDRIASQIHKTIGSLAARCPPDMTKEQWEVAVDWTAKLPDKSMLPTPGSHSLFDMRRFQSELDDLRRFQGELEEKAEGKVDMNLIFWIWDELAKISPAVPQYKKTSQKMRMLEEMQWREKTSSRRKNEARKQDSSE